MRPPLSPSAVAPPPHLARLGFALLILALLVLTVLPARAVEIQRVTSPGGVEAWLVEDHANPLFAVRFFFRGGSALDPKGKEGLAEMTSALLDEGAGDLESTAFQRRLEDLSAGLRFSSGADNFSGGLRALSETRDEAFEMLRLALTAARFDSDPVERIRSQLLAGLAESAEDPHYLAGRAWWSAAYPDHPYGRPSGGTPETVKGISAEDLRDFVRRRLARDNLVIGVVGDIDAAQLAPILDKVFGGLPASAGPWEVSEAKPRTSGGVKVVRKSIPQSVVIFGQRGLKRDDPDFYTAHVMNYILGGGGFNSRLYDEIREKRGLAYSVYSSLSPLRHSGLIMGGVGTQNQRVRESIELIRAEWRRMAEGGVSDAELTAAKTFLTGSFPLRFTSSRRIAGMLAGIQLETLGIDYLDRRNGFIEAVTGADVRRVARKWLDADTLTFVVVGDPEGLGGG